MGLAFGYNSGPFAVTLNYEDGDLNTLYYGGGTERLCDRRLHLR